MDKHRQPTVDDWDWWALRYIANELADEQQRWFEQQLVADEAACQALADAVELTCAVAVVERAGVAAPVPAGWHRAWHGTPVAYLAASVAAGLLIAVGCWQFQSLRSVAPGASSAALAGDEEAIAEEVPVEELAFAWWQSRLEAQAAENGIGLDPPWDGDQITPSKLAALQEAQLAPDWMLSALAVADEEATDEDMEEDMDEDGGEDAEKEAETVEG